MNDERSVDGRRRVTSIDVARRAGVSRSAVSRALTPGASVSDETRRKVLRAARDLGYRVNYLARGLSHQRSDLVGVVIADLDNPPRAQQLESLNDRLLARGYKPVCLQTGPDRDIAELIHQLLHYQVSGVIVTSDAPSAAICQECVDNNVPMVLVNKHFISEGTDKVDCDNEAGGRLAAARLLAGGARRLALVRPDRDSYSFDGRARGFAELLRERGADTRTVRVGTQSYEGGIRAAEALTSAGELPDGIFCAADYMALGLLDALRHRFGVSVPADCQLVGFDDVQQAGWDAYRLTTIRQPEDAISAAAVDALFARISDPAREDSTTVVPVELVERDTTRARVGR